MSITMAESWLLSQHSLLYTKTKFPIISNSNSVKPFKLQNPSSSSCNNNFLTFSTSLPLTTGRKRTRHSSFFTFAVDEFGNIEEDPNENLNISVPMPRAYDSPFGICISNLPRDIDNGQLEEIFSKHGKVESVEIVHDQQFNEYSSAGYLIMANETDMNNVIAAFNGQSLNGTELFVYSLKDERFRH
ncbi:unnamed protein product [Trifolium pratense]|uniref:Uncharacterized protein n=1 Tax=Trifolium pratense TaxID=57577 RepID=A0ACB0L7Y8_TRIPR|nr:unnamed protein product [Trifolium pratense]